MLRSSAACVSAGVNLFAGAGSSFSGSAALTTSFSAALGASTAFSGAADTGVGTTGATLSVGACSASRVSWPETGQDGAARRTGAGAGVGVMISWGTCAWWVGGQWRAAGSRTNGESAQHDAQPARG